MSEPRPSLARAWLSAARPATLLAGATPVFVGWGLAAAAGAFDLGPALAALAGCVLIQIGTNLANDLFDHKKGADNADRVGPARATQKGWLSPRQVAIGTALVLGLALAVGLYLSAHAGLPILILGLVSIGLAIAYTGGPFPLAYHGLGDLFVLLFFGFAAVGGTYYVQALALSPQAVLAGAPVGLLATAILVVNNLRDRHTDAAANKRTLAVRFGEGPARLEYTLCVVGAYAVPVFVVLSGYGGLGWLLPFLSLPIGVRQIRRLQRLDGPALNPQLGATAQLELVFGALLAIGVQLG